MKRRKLIKHLIEHGVIKDHEGRRHTIFVNPANGLEATVPRHAEINDALAYLICNQLGIPKPR